MKILLSKWKKIPDFEEKWALTDVSHPGLITTSTLSRQETAAGHRGISQREVNGGSIHGGGGGICAPWQKVLPDWALRGQTGDSKYLSPGHPCYSSSKLAMRRKERESSAATINGQTILCEEG